MCPDTANAMILAAACMLLHTAQDAPCFRGAMDDLFKYVKEVENLCWKCQHVTNADLIKWAVYYTDESSWDTFSATHELLEEPKTWEGFKVAISDMYLQYGQAHVPAPLLAS